MDLHTGVVRQLAETTALDPLSLSLDQSERFLRFLDGGTLKQLHIGSHRLTTIAEAVAAYTGRTTADLLLLRENRLQRPGGETLASDVEGPCLLSPDGTSCLFRQMSGQECEYAVLSLRSKSASKRLASGRVRSPFWSPDSQSVLLLRDTDHNGITLSEVHRVSDPATAEEAVSTTGQFASFAPNGDASVFVSASRSKAQPTVDLLLRSPKRELTLCEHRASHPDSVTPVFSPDSRRVYFQSDREGKPAIYSINVEKLVEPTAFQ